MRIPVTATGTTAPFQWIGGLRTVFVSGDYGGTTLTMRAGVDRNNLVEVGADNDAEWGSGDTGPRNFELGNVWVAFNAAGGSPDLVVEVSDL